MASGDGSGSLPILGWFDEPIKKSIKAVFEGVNASVEARDFIRKYRRAHFKVLKPTVSQFKILGMESPINLTDVYAPAIASTTIHRRLYKQVWIGATTPDSVAPPPGPSPEKSLVRADDFIERHKRVAVLGGPGSGKTTLLRYIALAMVDRSVLAASALVTSRFPFFVSLPVFAKNGASLVEYLSAGLVAATDEYAKAFVTRVVKSTPAIVLLDSLDEVPSPLRKVTVERIQQFADTFPNCAIVMSCRTADYSHALESLTEIELARLTRLAVHKIVKAWFIGEPHKASALIRHLKSDPGLASLTETPLLLSLLCIQFRHDLSLPHRKAELYRRCVDAFLRDWDASRGFRRDSAYAKLSDERKERLFEAIAERFFQPEPAFTFKEADLVAVVAGCCERFEIDATDAPAIVSEIERHHGILEKASMDTYAFSHPSFQEYFMAGRLLAYRRELDAVRMHLDNDAWAGVIEFVVALKHEPGDIMELVRSRANAGSVKYYPALARRVRALWLLYRCLAVGPSLSATELASVVDTLIESQFAMMRTMREDGVVPMSSLVEDGVKHSYYYFRRKRRTLAQALMEYRKLANEILLSPIPKYADAVLKRLATLNFEGAEREDNVAKALCFLTPLATARRAEVASWLAKLGTMARFKFVKALVDESAAMLETGYRDGSDGVGSRAQ